MKLYYSPASPFARKCRILLREKGLIDRVEEVRVDPLSAGADYTAINPLSQVPALVDDGGVVWNDSPLICARLDAMSGEPKLIPEGEARWGCLRREVLADGMMELGVKWRLESLRPDGERSSSWIARWRGGLERAIDAAETNTPAARELFDLGDVAIVCALTWLDFRHPELVWRGSHPKLAALQQGLENRRESFRATAPA